MRWIEGWLAFGVYVTVHVHASTWLVGWCEDNLWPRVPRARVLRRTR